MISKKPILHPGGPIKRALCILLTILPAAAVADQDKDSGIYGKFALGQSKIEFDSEFKQAPKSDDSDTSWEIAVGYQFGEKWSTELAWLDMGAHSLEGPISVSYGATDETFTRNGIAEADLQGAVLRAIRTFRISEKFSISANIGVYAWEQDGTGKLLEEEGHPEIEFDLDKSGYDLTYGISGGYMLHKNVSLSLDWARHSIFDADVYSASLKWRF